MANSTFSGPVRSENGFKVISTNSTTGAETDVAVIASTGIVTDKYVKHVGFATGVTVNTTAGDSPTIGEFTQPANTIITDIKIFCDNQIKNRCVANTQNKIYYYDNNHLSLPGSTFVVKDVIDIIKKIIN